MDFVFINALSKKAALMRRLPVRYGAEFGTAITRRIFP
jgi:hypothetical protein